MTETSIATTVRPLLVGGERLAVNVERVLGGGGDKYHPQSIEAARERLLPMSTTLVSAATSMPLALRAQNLVFQATLLPNYLANSYFPGTLLEHVGLRALGSRKTMGTLETSTRSRPAATKSLILAGPNSALLRLEALIADSTPQGRSRSDASEALRQFTDIRLARQEEVVKVDPAAAAQTPESTLYYEAVLHPDPDQQGALLPLDDDLLAKWAQWVTICGGEVRTDLALRNGGLTFLPISARPSAIDEIARFNLLRAIRPMPEIAPFPSFGDTLLRASVAVKLPQPSPRALPAQPVRVAVVDGGVDEASPYFSPYVSEHDLTGAEATDDGLQHGTAVTAACLYGNLTTKTSSLDPAPASIEHFRMEPATGGDPDALWLLKHLESTVGPNNYQIVNLSLGPAISVEDDNEPHTWTCTLDRLAHETDTLFVVAVGNNGSKDSQTGLNRVQVPGDMVNGLSVGACDAPVSATSWNRAEYSAVGPGRSGAKVQPGGLAFGGSIWAPFAALGRQGELLGCQGTSFAAPIVTNSLIHLASSLGKGRTNAATLRAFAIHGATRHPADHDETQHGFGLFKDTYDHVLDSDENEVTVLYQGAIARDAMVALRLPVPEGISKGMVDLSWTLAVTAPVEPTEAFEYTTGALDVVFRPHAQRYTYRSGKKSRSLNNVSDSAEVANLLASGYVPSTHPSSLAVAAGQGDEADRREAGKWETVRKFAVRKRAASFYQPRIDLSHVARRGGLLDRSVPPLRYALVATVRGPRGSGVYDLVRSQLGPLVQLQSAAQAVVRSSPTSST